MVGQVAPFLNNSHEERMFESVYFCGFHTYFEWIIGSVIVITILDFLARLTQMPSCNILPKRNNLFSSTFKRTPALASLFI